MRIKIYVPALRGGAGFVIPRGYYFVKKNPDNFYCEFWLFPFNLIARLYHVITQKKIIRK